MGTIQTQPLRRERHPFLTPPPDAFGTFKSENVLEMRVPREVIVHPSRLPD